jgi:cytochrome c peroxidase
MTRFKMVCAGGVVCAGLFVALDGVAAHGNSTGRAPSWALRGKIHRPSGTLSFSPAAQAPGLGPGLDGPALAEAKRLFESETFGGNGRTCQTCHGKDTGTVSPLDAQRRFQSDPSDPLFIHDGSDDGNGNGVTRMLAHATVLMTIPMHANVEIVAPPELAGNRTVTVRRGIPTTINTPALDPVLMYDGRQDTLEHQAAGAIAQHAQSILPTPAQLALIAQFQKTDPRFFSSPALMAFAHGSAAPVLPKGNTPSEKRGRRFFVDSAGGEDGKEGLCATCHSGPLLNTTNEFLQLAIAVGPGERFQTVLVSELNNMGNSPITFTFHNQTRGPSPDLTFTSPDPGRALITGIAYDSVGNPAVDDPFDPLTFQFNSLNAFKIPPLRGIKHTAPYFHDNSSKTLEDVAAHYALFFLIVTSGIPGVPPLILTTQDQADIVAYMKLL